MLTAGIFIGLGWIRVAFHAEDHVPFTYGSEVVEELHKFRESREV